MAPVTGATAPTSAVDMADAMGADLAEGDTAEGRTHRESTTRELKVRGSHFFTQIEPN